MLLKPVEIIPGGKLLDEKRNDLKKLFSDFRDSDIKYAKVEYLDVEYPDARHCYKSLYNSLRGANSWANKSMRVVFRNKEVYLVKK